MTLSAFTGFVGIALLLGVAYLLSNNRKAIDWRLIVSGLALQFLLAVFCLKFELGRLLFQQLGHGVEKLLSFSNQGASFVFGFLVGKPQRLVELFGPGADFIFAFKLIPTIIFVATLVAIAYHLGIMQRVVKAVAFIVYKIMGVSGAEALSNSASIFVGQIEAQLLIKPYIASMTRSELLTVMAGSMACISGGAMAVYVQMGVPASYLLTASLMAVPGALAIAKMLYPETEQPVTRGSFSLDVEKQSVNILDAASQGASDGMKIGLGVIAMLIGFIALVALVDFLVGQLGLGFSNLGLDAGFMGLNLDKLSLNTLLGSLFYWVALSLGVPAQDALAVGGLMGTKMVINEFVAYANLTPMIASLNAKSVAIASFALCGFANFSSIAMQIGGIGEMAPQRKKDLAQLGFRALLCGTMASYISSALAGILMDIPTGQSPVIPIILMALAALVIGLTNWLQRRLQGSRQTPLIPAAPPSLNPILLDKAQDLSDIAAKIAYEKQIQAPGSLTMDEPPPITPSDVKVDGLKASSYTL